MMRHAQSSLNASAILRVRTPRGEKHAEAWYDTIASRFNCTTRSSGGRRQGVDAERRKRAFQHGLELRLPIVRSGMGPAPLGAESRRRFIEKHSQLLNELVGA
jgi:hypothetical protein